MAEDTYGKMVLVSRMRYGELTKAEDELKCLRAAIPEQKHGLVERLLAQRESIARLQEIVSKAVRAEHGRGR